jgi:hypothetical protein
MIISYLNKFIFIRVPKTASTSVEVALTKFCGPDDVISGVHFHNDLENAILDYEGERNIDRLHLNPFNQFIRKLTGQPPIDYKHASAKNLKALLSRKDWEGFYKFCFVRNPFERVLSLYHWRMKNWEKKHAELKPSINQYISDLEPNKITTWQRYTIHGKIVVDHVARYEDLHDEFRKITESLGLGVVELPMNKSSIRKDRTHYRELLDPTSRTKIEKLCAKEMVEFGYHW